MRYRFEKYVKRHKVGVMAVFLVLASLIGGSSIATWQAIEARREREKAELRFKDVRQLANSIVFEFHDSIEKLPGSTPSRELLIRRALEYLDKLAVEPEKDLTLQMELADAYIKIGDIQGGFNSSHLGQREKSFESYNKALSILQNLVAADPTNTGFQGKLATCYRRIGGAYWVKTDIEESLENYKKSFEINQKLSEELSDDAETQYQLAISQSDFGRLLAANGHTEEGLTNSRQAQNIMERLTDKDPNNQKFLTGLALTYDKVAEILTGLTENYSDARELILKSQAISLRLLEKNPQDTALRRAAAVGYLDISNILVKLNDPKTALENARRSLEMFEELLNEDPKNEEFQQIVAAVETEYCGILITTGNAQEAISRLNKSLETYQKLKAESPTDEIITFRIATTYEYLGKGYEAMASVKKVSSFEKISNLRKANDFLLKSFAIYKEFRDAGKTVGEEAAKVEELEQEISNCEKSIAKLNGK
jgi:tetratricopeptide (TPR) repeat protein